MAEERDSLEKRLIIHQGNLCKLEEQAAVYGAGAVPLLLLNQIEAEKKAIAEIEDKLERLKRGRRARGKQRPTERRGCLIWWGSLSDGTKAAYIGPVGVIMAAIIGLIGVLGVPVVTEWAKFLFATPTPTMTPALTPVPALTPTLTSSPALTAIPTSTNSPTPTFTPTSCPLGDAFTYTDPASIASITVEEERPGTIKITFDNPSERSYCGWGIRLHGCDAHEKVTLSFSVKGERGGEQFEVGIRDTLGKESKVSRTTSSTTWQRVTVPLNEFQGVNLSSLDNLSIGFRYELGSGTIYVAEFTFDSP